MKTASFVLVLLGSFVIANAIAAGDVKKGKAKTQACIACHGPVGDAKAPSFPKLAGQNAAYLVKQLQDFKTGVRKDATMNGMVQSLSPADMKNIGAFYASQKTSLGIAKKEHVVIGRKIYEGGNPRTKVPACMGCHSPTGLGNAAAKYPALAGQHAAYTVKQLKAFREVARLSLKLKAEGKELPDKFAKGRSNDDSSVMRTVVQDMSDAEIEAVASYIQGLRVR